MLVCLQFLDMLILDKVVKHYIRRKGFFLNRYVSVVVRLWWKRLFSQIHIFLYFIKIGWLTLSFTYFMNYKFWVTTVNRIIMIGTSEERVLAYRIRANQRCMDVITIPCVMVVNITFSKRIFSVVTHKQSLLDVENRGKWHNREFPKCKPSVSQIMDSTHPSKNSLYKKLHLATELPPPIF